MDGSWYAWPVKILPTLLSKPEAVRVATLLDGLEKSPPGPQVFEVFEELDGLPRDVVQAVLVSRTGPQRAPEQLDEATRRAHGFADPPLIVRCASASRPSKADELRPLDERQVRRAGVMWDGQDLLASERLRRNGGDASFAGSLELKTFSSDHGQPLFDAVLWGPDGQKSGAIFHAGTTDLAAAVAYGVVEMKDPRTRVALQSVLERGAEAVPAYSPKHAVDAASAIPLADHESYVAGVTIAKAALQEPANRRTAPTHAKVEKAAKSLPAQVAQKVRKLAAAENESSADATLKNAAPKKAAAKAAPKKAAAKTTPKKAAAKTTPKKAAAKTTPKKAAVKATPKKAATKVTPKKAAAKATSKKAATKATSKKAAKSAPKKAKKR